MKNLPSKRFSKQEIQGGLLKVLKNLTSLPAQIVFYGSALLTIAATGGVALPGVLSMLASTVGVNTLSSILERVANGEDISEDTIRKVVEEAISSSGIENLLTSQEFQRALAYVFQRFDLLSYAVQNNEISIAAVLSTQLTQYNEMMEILNSEFSNIHEQLEKLATREQSDEILRSIQKLVIYYETSPLTNYSDRQANSSLLYLLDDEAKAGPRLFSTEHVRRSAFNPREWVMEKYKLTLYCEHSYLPLTILNNGSSDGVYYFEVTRKWFKEIAPYLSFILKIQFYIFIGAIILFPVVMGELLFKTIQAQTILLGAVLTIVFFFSRKFEDMLHRVDQLEDLIRSGQQKFPQFADGATLRKFHAILKKIDPGFGGLVRVINYNSQYLWVHERFVSEYTK